MPGWLERVKNDYLLRRISRHDLDEIHDLAVKAAIKDQEVAGVDVDHRRRAPARQHDRPLRGAASRRVRSTTRPRSSTTTSTTAWSARACPPAALGLVEEFRFLRRFTDRRTKISVTGPHSLVKRIRNEHYPSRGGLRARHRAGDEPGADASSCKAGATDIQIDEPYYSGFPEDLPWAIAAVNALVDGVDARIGLHICYGNRYGKPSVGGQLSLPVPRRSWTRACSS